MNRTSRRATRSMRADCDDGHVEKSDPLKKILRMSIVDHRSRTSPRRKCSWTTLIHPSIDFCGTVLQCTASTSRTSCVTMLDLSPATHLLLVYHMYNYVSVLPSPVHRARELPTESCLGLRLNLAAS